MFWIFGKKKSKKKKSNNTFFRDTSSGKLYKSDGMNIIEIIKK